MATPRDTGIFLEERSYRLRRLVDGVRIVPVVGAWAFMLPLLWPDGETQAENAVSMSSALIFIFAIWLGLIVMSAGLLLARIALRRRSPEPEQGG